MYRGNCLKDTVMVKLKELKPYLAEKYGIVEIGLFGSVVRNEHRPDSDIDILIDYDVEKMGSVFRLVGLKLFLEKEFGRKVDLVPKNGIRHQLKKQILSEVIYA